MFRLIKIDVMKIRIIRVSVLPIRFGLSLLVNRILIPKAKESRVHELKSTPVRFIGFL